MRASAASLASLLVADGTGILNSAWADRLSLGGMAGLVSLLLSIAAGAQPGTGPSFGTETPTENVAVAKDPKTGNLVAADAYTGAANGTPVDVDIAAA